MLVVIAFIDEMIMQLNSTLEVGRKDLENKPVRAR